MAAALESGHTASIDAARTTRPRKPPRPLSLEVLEEAALRHLARYATTVAQLRRVLVRKVDRSMREQPGAGDRQEALGWVQQVVGKLTQKGFVNDHTYAESKARSLRAAGRSGRMIALKLRTKGVAAELTTRMVAQATADLSEEAAAMIFARKRRLGPFRRDSATRSEHRQRDLASLARAGFSFGIARRIVDGAE